MLIFTMCTGVWISRFLSAMCVIETMKWLIKGMLQPVLAQLLMFPLRDQTGAVTGGVEGKAGLGKCCKRGVLNASYK